MPKTVTLDDGTEEEVYTKEEVDGLQKGSDKNKERKEELSQLKKDLEVGDDGSIIDSIAELKENANPNFAKFRTKHNAMEKELKNNGKEFDNNGKLIKDGSQITNEQIQEKIESGIKTALSGNETESALAAFEGEEKKLVKHYLDKLMPTGGTLQENMDLAITKAFPDKDVNDVKRVIANSGGGRPAPYTGDKKKTFTETDAGLKMLNQNAPAGYEVKVVDGKHKYVKKQ